MGRFDCRAGETDEGATTLVLDLDEGFGQVRLPVVLWRPLIDVPETFCVSNAVFSNTSGA